MQTFMFARLTVRLIAPMVICMDTERIYKDLGARIRGLRKGLGQTQERLAAQIGMSRASLANIEAGRQQVLVHHLFAVAEALQLDSPAQLLLSPRTRTHARDTDSELPVAGEGLTEKQRREVLRLMGGVLDAGNGTKGRGDV
jgi:transcriptional regulator with XRE-family HTH domain